MSTGRCRQDKADGKGKRLEDGGKVLGGCRVGGMGNLGKNIVVL
jgi:hypothetical protein